MAYPTALAQRPSTSLELPSETARLSRAITAYLGFPRAPNARTEHHSINAVSHAISAHRCRFRHW
jgi:hypothetical protein